MISVVSFDLQGVEPFWNSKSDAISPTLSILPQIPLHLTTANRITWDAVEVRM